MRVTASVLARSMRKGSPIFKVVNGLLVDKAVVSRQQVLAIQRRCDQRPCGMI